MRQQHKHYSCIRAFADGWEIIQYMPIQKKWITVANPNFSPEFMFHVVPDENGWLPWYGGECPVAAGTVVEVIYKGGPTIIMVQAHFIRWGHADKIRDIIAYRVIKEAETDPYAELKAAAKDPTKQIKYTFPDGVSDGWHDYNHDWSFQGLLSGYEVRNKPQKIKLLAYIGGSNEELLWRIEGYEMSSYWKRVPSEDKEVDVE
jgi:hypothetical protein